MRRDKIIGNLGRKSWQKECGGRDTLKRFILSKTLRSETKAMEMNIYVGIYAYICIIYNYYRGWLACVNCWAIS